MRDWGQRELCVNCWNGAHYFKWLMTNEIGQTKPKKVIVSSGKGVNVFTNCLQGTCQCPCVDLMKEKHPKIEPDKQSQLEMFDAAQASSK